MPDLRSQAFPVGHTYLHSPEFQGRFPQKKGLDRSDILGRRSTEHSTFAGNKGGSTHKAEHPCLEDPGTFAAAEQE